MRICVLGIIFSVVLVIALFILSLLAALRIIMEELDINKQAGSSYEPQQSVHLCAHCRVKSLRMAVLCHCNWILLFQAPIWEYLLWAEEKKNQITVHLSICISKGSCELPSNLSLKCLLLFRKLTLPFISVILGMYVLHDRERRKSCSISRNRPLK